MNWSIDDMCDDFHYITDVLESSEFHDKLLAVRKAVTELNELINSGHPEVCSLVRYDDFFPVDTSYRKITIDPNE